MKKQNLELKYYCEDFGKIRSVLKQIGAKKESVKNQKDYFFELPKDKSRTSSKLKFRIENGKPKEVIYYERPNFSKKVNTMSDIELYATSDINLLSFLTKVLGVKAVVEKKREVWRKDNTVFYIDIVKDVGNIFEVELWAKSVITEKDRNIFESYKEKLLPYLGPMVKGSNLDLVLKNKKI